MKKTILAATLAAGLLAGCGGGGRTTAVPAASSSASSAAHTVQVAVRIVIPTAAPASASAGKRRPAYISPATQAAVVDVTPAGAPTVRTIIPCGNSVCSGSVPATVGNDTFVISLNDRSSGTGNTLASGTTTAAVVEGKPNAVNVIFNGVVASLAILFDNQYPHTHQSSTVTVHVTALDADGNTIIGPGVYDNPISVTDGDTSGASSMTPQTITGPADPAFTVGYNGAWIGGDCACIPIVASVPNNAAVKPVTARIIPAPQAVEYSTPTLNASPTDLTKGPDGAIWFTEQSVHQIGRVTTSGTFNEYAVPGSGQYTYQQAQPWAITAGGDGNLWFTDNNGGDQAIDSITTTGTVTRHSIHRPNGFRDLFSIVWGPDGNLWAPDSPSNQIVRLTPAGVETDFPIPTYSANAQYIVNGPDGALWFTEPGGAKIARITTAGTITEYSTLPTPANVYAYNASTPTALTVGPDGALWYIDSTLNQIGHATTSGTVTQFPRSQSYSAQGTIVNGPDGAVYFGTGSGYVGRISPSGTTTLIPIQQLRQRGGQPTRLAVGGDNNLWYVDTYGSIVGKIVF
jgi:virginiamycin B lyase